MEAFLMSYGWEIAGLIAIIMVLPMVIDWIKAWF